jgi:hypothetical protein
VAAGGVVGVALGVFLGCAGPAVAVAPERHPVDLAEAVGRLLCGLGGRLLLAGRGRRPLGAFLPDAAAAAEDLGGALREEDGRLRSRRTTGRIAGFVSSSSSKNSVSSALWRRWAKLQ